MMVKPHYTSRYGIEPTTSKWPYAEPLETDWLGYKHTPTGLKPWKTDIHAVLHWNPPNHMESLVSLAQLIAIGISPLSEPT